MIRLLIVLLFALAGAAEQWLLGQSAGDVVVGGFVLGFGFLVCSPRATALQSHLKIAVLLLGLVVLSDALGLAVTGAIDGKASSAGGSWMIAVIATWLLLEQSKVGQWVGLQPVGQRASRG